MGTAGISEGTVGKAGWNQVDTVVFDLDGTLVDSVVDVGAILQEMRAERGLPAADEAAIRYWSSRGGTRLILATLECTEAEAEGLLAEFRARYAQRPTTPSSLFDGVADALCALSAAGIRLALCTNKPERLAIKVLEELGLRAHFGPMVCGDSLDRKKPDPLPLLEALRLAGGTPERAVLIGDSSVDQRTAAAAGVAFCFFEGGYDDGVAREPSLLSVASIADVVPLVRGVSGNDAPVGTPAGARR